MTSFPWHAEDQDEDIDTRVSPPHPESILDQQDEHLIRGRRCDLLVQITEEARIKKDRENTWVKELVRI